MNSLAKPRSHGPVELIILLSAAAHALLAPWAAEVSYAHDAIILRGAEESYREASAAMAESLTRAGVNHAVIEWPASDDDAGRKEALRRIVTAPPKVIAAAGTSATSAALEAVPNVPVVFFMVPNALDVAFWADERQRTRLAGVTTDIEPALRIDWARRLAPATKRLAVLHSPRTPRTLEAVRAAAKSRDVELLPIAASKDDFPRAVEELSASRCDGVLMLPDAQVYNAATVQRLLLWGIRERKTVWAFSSNIAKAGALGAQFASDVEIGRQAGDIVVEVVKGRDIAALGLQYPHRIQRAVNERTAELIGLSLKDISLEADTVRFGAEP